MTVGQRVAKAWKRQYHDKSKGWAFYPDWEIQAEEIYTILLELKTEKAVTSLVDKGWLKSSKEQ